ncbi:MAG: glycosyltransferase family 4 protein, partial [Candidatus Aminicenantaceae bacterium]
MKVLFLADFVPYPETSGSKLRAAGLLRSLKDHEVHLVVLKERSESVDNEHLPRLCSHLYVLDRPEFSPLRRCINHFSFKPLLSKKRFHSSIHDVLSNIIREHRIEVIIAETLLLAEYARGRSEVFSILDEHNLEFVRAGRRNEVARGFLLKLKTWLIFKRLERYELEAIKDFDTVFVCSQTDRDVITRRLPGQVVQVVPNSVDTDYFAFHEDRPISHKIVYIGTMWYEPNRDAALYFADQALALLRAERPELEFLIVGDQPPQARSIFSRKEGIVLTGFVEDVRPFLHEAALSVVPLRMGSGTRLKILASMAAGTPVVSTSVGCEGLSVTDGKNICIADSPAQFKTQILRLL